MTAFKIGDKIRRKSEYIDVDFFASSGEVVTVKFISINRYFSIEEDDGERLWNSDYFELVEDNKMTQNKPHKHAELIKAWADGAEIECWNERKLKWESAMPTPAWNHFIEYRLKPIPKPDIIRNVFVEDDYFEWKADMPNLELTFDPESGALKAAKVL